jgi:hypothetical protein
MREIQKNDCECEPLFGYGNTFDTGLPVGNTSKKDNGEIKKNKKRVGG